MVHILNSRDWQVYQDYPFFVEHHRGHGDTDEEGVYFRHEFDIKASKRHSNGLISTIIVEIDGKKHNSDEQQRRDRKAEAYATFFMEDVRIVRIPIDLLLNNSIPDDTIVKEYRLN